MLTRAFRFLPILILALVTFVAFQGCNPEDEGTAFDNLPPTARLANVPPNDPTIDTAGTDGNWNVATDDLGADGLNDNQETGCLGDYDPVSNPDPAFDNYDPAKVDRCQPDSGNFMSDPSIYKQNNGKPDVGEPHVTKPRPFKSPLVKLYWVGNDPDGYVTAFMYRWTYKDKYADTTVHLRPWITVLNYVTNDNDRMILVLDVPEADAPKAALEVFKYFTNTDLDPEKRNPSSPNYDTSLVNTYERLATGQVSIIKNYRVYASNPRGNRYPVHESPNAGTFIFESDDFLNRHEFEIRAIDNEQAIGRSDTVRFWTPKVEPPRVTIVYSLGASVLPTDTVFVLDNLTYTWPGIKFTFNGSDRNSRVITYSWKVDNKDWKPFQSSTIARITAADIDTPYTGRHVFRVRARNEFGTITPPDSQPQSPFNAVYPGFVTGIPKRVLLVNVNKNPAANTITKSNRPEAEIMQYYQNIFNNLGIPNDIYNPRGTGHPSFAKLADYSTIYIVSDNLPPGDSRMQIQTKRYSDYLAAGGTMLMNAVAWTVYPTVFATSPETLLVQRFQLRDLQDPAAGGTYVMNREFDCIGAFGDARAGYPTLEIDTSKCDPDTGAIQGSWVARTTGLRRIFKCQPQGFAETIYRFNSNVDSLGDNSEFPAKEGFENEICGLRYIGATYRSVWFGVPLFYMKQDQAQAAIRKAMIDLGYEF